MPQLAKGDFLSTVIQHDPRSCTRLAFGGSYFTTGEAIQPHQQAFHELGEVI